MFISICLVLNKYERLYDVCGNMWKWYPYYFVFVKSLNNPTSLASGTYRVIRGDIWYFYVADFNKKKIIYRCRSVHGLRGGSTARNPVFYNFVESKCSSLEKLVVSSVGAAHFRNRIVEY